MSIKKRFEAIDKSDEEALRDFFLDYPFLTTNDFAQLLGVSSKTIRRTRHKIGLRGNNNGSNPVRVQVKQTIELPEDWDNEQWWKESYAKYGRRILARSTGLNMITVRKRLDKYHIRKRPKGFCSTHPCCDRTWLTEHYVRQELSLRDCAKLAGVSKDTVAGWLNRFSIPIRMLRYVPIVGEVASI